MGQGSICPGCWASLEPWAGPACSRCGIFFGSGRALDSSEALCGDCQQGENAFRRARSWGLYAGRLRAAILLLKFRRRERIGPRLGAVLASLWVPVEEGCQGRLPVVVSVPLHPSRQRERGFNQAELLARGLIAALEKAGHVPLPRLDARCLARTRSTESQAGLDPRGRRENVRGVFHVTNARLIRGADVVLVDDVMTTGATVSACSEALRRAGARQVLVLTVARATPQFPDVTAAGPDLSRP